MGVIRGRDAVFERLAGADTVGTAVTLGAFDGVHIGHQSLFSLVARAARERGLDSAAVTFDPHPVAFFNGQDGFRCLATHSENLALLAAQPLDHIAVLEFSAPLAALEPRAFAEQILVETLRARCLIMGPAHRFGRGQAGDIVVARTLGAEMGFEVVAATAEQRGGDLVSSTRIRDALDAGDVVAARLLLGRAYSISGPVQEGEKRGRTLGFPTANVVAPPCKIVPPSGVYAGFARIEGGAALPAVVYVGRSPTFQGRSNIIVECHILQAPGAREIGGLYGRWLSVLFVRHLREDRTFDGPESLCAQIERDIARAEEVLADEEPSSVR